MITVYFNELVCNKTINHYYNFFNFILSVMKVKHLANVNQLKDHRKLILIFLQYELQQRVHKTSSRKH